MEARLAALETGHARLAAALLEKDQQLALLRDQLEAQPAGSAGLHLVARLQGFLGERAMIMLAAAVSDLAFVTSHGRKRN